MLTRFFQYSLVQCFPVSSNLLTRVTSFIDNGKCIDLHEKCHFDRKLFPLYFWNSRSQERRVPWGISYQATLIKSFSIKSESGRATVQSWILPGVHGDINPSLQATRGHLPGLCSAVAVWANRVITIPGHHSFDIPALTSRESPGHTSLAFLVRSEMICC